MGIILPTFDEYSCLQKTDATETVTYETLDLVLSRFEENILGIDISMDQYEDTPGSNFHNRDAREFK